MKEKKDYQAKKTENPEYIRHANERKFFNIQCMFTDKY